MSRHLPSSYATGLLLLVSGAACAGPEKKTGEGQNELSPQEFQELLAAGTIEPVTELDDDPYADVDPERAMDEPFLDPDRVAAVLDPGELEPVQRPQGPPPENPYLVFGERIYVNVDGTITKPFPMRVGTGKRMEDLIRAYGNFPMWGGEGRATPETLKMETLEKWDVEPYHDLRDPNAAANVIEVALADWLVVTTGFDLLLEVENFINLFGAGVPQIEIEAKIVEIAWSDSIDIGVTTKFNFPPGTFVDTFESTTPNLADADEALLSVGGVLNGTVFSATLEAIATMDNVSIISRPKIAVREGGRADISNTQRIPFLDITGVGQGSGGFTAQVSYQEVGVKLFVVPRVVGTETVALNIDIEASQQSGSEQVAVNVGGTGQQSTIIPVPVLSFRNARTTVYLQPGQAVILGGLITERTVDSERKVPILGDIPIVNFLFRSKFKEKQQVNVLFFIRPRILEGTDLYREF